MKSVMLDDALIAKLRSTGSEIVTLVGENGDILGQIRLFEEPDTALIVDTSDTDE